MLKELYGGSAETVFYQGSVLSSIIRIAVMEGCVFQSTCACQACMLCSQLCRRRKKYYQQITDTAILSLAGGAS